MTHRLEKHARAIESGAERFAAAFGVDVAIEHGGRHPRVVLTRGAVRRIVPFSISPRRSDESVQCTLQAVRRKLREFCAA